MAAVDILCTQGVGYTLDAAGEQTPDCGAGVTAGLVAITIVYDASWSGTLQFEAATRRIGADGTVTVDYDPIRATNTDGGAEGTTTTGTTSEEEIWRVDVSGFWACRVNCTARAGGSALVYFNQVPG
jgi:hypothetical protein